MNTKELIAIANELVQKPCYTCESKALAEHVLQTVKEDDDELLTNEWIDALGQCTRTVFDNANIWFTSSLEVYIESYETKVKTRGQLRSLIKLLGG